MNASDYEITSGYVGPLGKTYTEATEETLAEAIAKAATLNSVTVDEICNALENGLAARWQESPNFYYDHAYGLIRRKRAATVVTMKRCDCGHEVPVGQVMAASLGTSCPDCYDRMSDG